MINTHTLISIVNNWKSNSDKVENALSRLPLEELNNLFDLCAAAYEKVPSSTKEYSSCLAFLTALDRIITSLDFDVEAFEYEQAALQQAWENDHKSGELAVREWDLRTEDWSEECLDEVPF